MSDVEIEFSCGVYLGDISTKLDEILSWVVVCVRVEGVVPFG